MTTNNEDDAARLWSLIRPIGVAMMTTEDGGVLRGRPMAAVDRDFDGALWFFTRADSHKIAEIKGDDRVGLSYADPSSQTYASLSGTAVLVRDPAAIAEHWTESARVWFPKGKTDPDIALLRVTVTQAEVWDAPSATMLLAYGYVKAVLTGEPPRPGGHATYDNMSLTSRSTDM